MAVADFGSQLVVLLSASTGGVVRVFAQAHCNVERPIDIAELPDSTLLIADASGDCLVRVDREGVPLSVITKLRGPCTISIASVEERVALVVREEGSKSHMKIRWLNLEPASVL